MIHHVGHQPLQFFTEEDACACPEMPLCFKVTTEDTTSFQIHLGEFDDVELLMNNTFAPYVSGTADGGSGVTTLIDAGASFENFGVQAGWVVKNTTSGIEGTVTSVDSQTQLTTTNAFAAADGYQIYAWSGTNINVRWDFDGSTLTRTASAGSDTIEGETPELCDDVVYRVRVTVLTVTGTSGALIITVGGGAAQTMAIPEAGSYSLNFPPQAVTNGLTITTNAAATGMVIDRISLERISSPEVNIDDCNTGVAVLEDADVVEYLPASTVFPLLTHVPAMVNVDWETLELPNGCYRICVIDVAEFCIEYICNGEINIISGTATSNVLNKLVDSSERWPIYDLKLGTSAYNVTDDITGDIVSVDSNTNLTLDSDAFPDGNEDWAIANCWTILNQSVTGWNLLGVDVAIYDSTHEQPDYFYQNLETTLDATWCYELTFEVVSINAGTVHVMYNVDSGASPTTDIELDSFTTAGVKTVSITGLAIERITFASSVLETPELEQFVIDNVSLKRVPCEEVDCVIFSECICLEAHPCTKAITATNDDDIDTGNDTYLDFTNFTWSMLLRAAVKLWHPKKKDGGYQLYVSDSGAGIRVHADRTKVTRTIFERMPADRIMALWDMLGMDTFAIDTVGYYTETSDIDPEYDDFSNDSEVQIELVKQYDKFENVNA